MKYTIFAIFAVALIVYGYIWITNKKNKKKRNSKRFLDNHRKK